MRKQSDKYREQLIDLMAHSESDINSDMRDKVRKIVLLCSGLNDNNFTFNNHKAIEKKVDKIIDELSGDIYDSVSSRAKKAINLAYQKEHEVFKNALFISFMSLLIDGKTIADRINSYLSGLKLEIESYIAVGLNNSDSMTSIFNNWYYNRKKPYNSSIIKSNIGKFEAEGLNKGIRFGSGYNSSSFMGLKELEMNNTFQSYNYILNEIWKEKGINGWYTVRGSNYPCPICQAQVGKFHPMSDKFLGYHNRCCCIMLPYTKDNKSD